MGNFLWSGDVPAGLLQGERQPVVADYVWGAGDVRNADNNNALRAEPVWPLDIDNLVGLGIAAPTWPQGQTVAGIPPLNGNTPHEGTSLAWPGFPYYQQLACGATTTVPGNRNPGVANNGVTLPPPPNKLPSENPSAIAPGSHLQKVLPEVGAGSATSKAVTPRKRRKPSARQTGVEPATEFVCEECSKTRGYPVSFNCSKDLQRHKRTTKAHNACAVVYCSCGTGVTRKDAMKSHHQSCEGVIVAQ
jgi:hypothetical protein